MLGLIVRAKSQHTQLRGDQKSTIGKPASVDEQETDSDPERQSIYCATCNRKITSEVQKFPMKGKPEHTFFNPAGQVFHIGCFKEAPGCIGVGTPSSEFSWFAGHQWRIACCGGCQSHLGWLFMNGTYFYGLILARLKGDSA